MRCRALEAAGLACAVMLALATPARAQGPLHRLWHHCEACVAGVCAEEHEIPYQHPADPAGEARYNAAYNHCRAGHPLCISAHAAPSTTPSYSGYYVGGGSARHGDPRCPAEGTWGWDYVGGHLPRHVYLRWNHGRRDQGGTGAYTVDGPEVPNVFFALRPRLRHEEP